VAQEISLILRAPPTFHYRQLINQSSAKVAEMAGGQGIMQDIRLPRANERGSGLQARDATPNRFQLCRTN